MVAGIFSIGTTPTTEALSVQQFYGTPPLAPGNIVAENSDRRLRLHRPPKPSGAQKLHHMRGR